MQIRNNKPSFGMAVRVNTKGMTPEEIGGILIAAPIIKKKAKNFDVFISKTTEKLASSLGKTDEISTYSVVVSKLKKSLAEKFYYARGCLSEGEAFSGTTNLHPAGNMLATDLIATVDRARANYLSNCLNYVRYENC